MVGVTSNVIKPGRPYGPFQFFLLSGGRWIHLQKKGSSFPADPKISGCSGRDHRTTTAAFGIDRTRLGSEGSRPHNEQDRSGLTRDWKRIRRQTPRAWRNRAHHIPVHSAPIWRCYESPPFFLSTKPSSRHPHSLSFDRTRIPDHLTSPS